VQFRIFTFSYFLFAFGFDFVFAHANERAKMYLKATGYNLEPGGSTGYGRCLEESAGKTSDELVVFS